MGLRKVNIMRNPFQTLSKLTAQSRAGEEKMAAYDINKAEGTTAGQLMKPRTFREQMQDQIAQHQAKIKDLQSVLDSMTPEVEKFVEALQKANL
jgi:hypothetical protein